MAVVDQENRWLQWQLEHTGPVRRSNTIEAFPQAYREKIYNYVLSGKSISMTLSGKKGNARSWDALTDTRPMKGREVMDENKPTSYQKTSPFGHNGVAILRVNRLIYGEALRCLYAGNRFIFPWIITLYLFTITPVPLSSGVRYTTATRPGIKYMKAITQKAVRRTLTPAMTNLAVAKRVSSMHIKVGSDDAQYWQRSDRSSFLTETMLEYLQMVSGSYSERKRVLESITFLPRSDRVTQSWQKYGANIDTVIKHRLLNEIRKLQQTIA